MVLGPAEVRIGKIVRSESHVRYTCQIFARSEVGAQPQPADYAFGRFVRMPLREAAADVLPGAGWPAADVAGGPHAMGAPPTWAVGLIYDTLLLNPAFGTLGPRLSTEEQVAVFSPDYLTECAVLVSILLLGTMRLDPRGATHVSHGVPPLAPDLGAEVFTLSDGEITAFHSIARGSGPEHATLHMGYVPLVMAQDHALLPQALLGTIERLEVLFPADGALLSVVKRALSWRLKVESAG